MYSLLIFDWDGTLIDSEAKIISSMQAAAQDVAWPQALSAEAVRSIIGLGLPEAIRTLCPGIDETQAQALRERYGVHFLELNTQPMPMFAQVAEGLPALKAAGYQLAVATGKSRRGLNRGLQETQTQDLFACTRCADETRSKPHPQMLHEILEELKVPVQQALMIGDTEFDLAMAQSIQMPRLGVTYGAHPQERLQACEPVALLDTFAEVLQWLLQHKN